MKIMLDPGHGGHDSGAVGGGVNEKDINLAVALQVAGHLSLLGHRVACTRDIDTYLTLQERCDKANSWGADGFLSIHSNAAENPIGNGFEVWTNPQFDAADVWASALWYRFRSTFPTMRGRADFSDSDPDFESKFFVLVHTVPPACLFELGFITNDEDRRRMLDPVWQVKASYGLAAATNEWGLRL